MTDLRTILVVEDEPIVQMMVVDILGEFGYRTLEAADANGALAILAAQPEIDLLITDIGLPGTDGRSLAEMARRDRPALPVLFATGYGEATGRIGPLEPGMDVVSKPFDVDTLAQKVRALIGA